MRRISIQGAKFSGFLHHAESSDEVDVVIVNAGPVSRSYFEGVFDPQLRQAPTCWSADTQRPAPEVPEEQRQSTRCMDCVHNIRGSSSGGGRACRFHQRLAVVEEQDLSTVYQLQVPASSIFGKEVNNSCMPLQVYAKFLSGHGTPSVAVVTRISFDVGSPYPKLFFYPRRPLEEDELEKVSLMVDHDDALEAISQTTTSDTLFDTTEGFDINSQSGDQNG